MLLKTFYFYFVLASRARFLPQSLSGSVIVSILGDDPLFTPVASDAWEALTYYRLDHVNTVFWDTQVCCNSFPCDTCLRTEWPLVPVPALIILKDNVFFFSFQDCCQEKGDWLSFLQWSNAKLVGSHLTLIIMAAGVVSEERATLLMKWTGNQTTTETLSTLTRFWKPLSSKLSQHPCSGV